MTPRSARGRGRGEIGTNDSRSSTVDVQPLASTASSSATMVNGPAGVSTVDTYDVLMQSPRFARSCVPPQADRRVGAPGPPPFGVRGQLLRIVGQAERRGAPADPEVGGQ